MVPMFERSSADTEGLAVLYRRYSAWLHARLTHRYGADVADDLVQEAYLRIAPYQAQGIRSPQSLLLRIASNLALDRFARDAVRRRHRQSALDSTEAFGDTHETLLLKQIVRSMPEKDRDVFVLSRFGGLTHAHIAARLGVAVKEGSRRKTCIRRSGVGDAPHVVEPVGVGIGIVRLRSIEPDVAIDPDGRIGGRRGIEEGFTTSLPLG